MAADLQTAAAFYASAQGVMVARLLRERLLRMWPHTTGQTLLGLGYVTPFLPAWRDSAARCLSAALVPATAWPEGDASLSCTVLPDSLPFADLSLDRILVVHGLENAESVRRTLREVWRVLKDDGRLVVVAPNRAGLWARADTTPFGQGAHFSSSQIARLLTGSLFRVERRDCALFAPPSGHRLVLRSAPVVERVGRRLVPQLAGLTITEAVKDVYAALPLEAVPGRRLVVAEAA